MKPKLIYVEGLDRSGKTSFINEFNLLTNFKHIIVDRGPFSFMAYDEIFSRPVIERTHLVTNDSIMVFLNPTPETLTKRFKLTNEPELPVHIPVAYYIFNKYRGLAVENFKDQTIELDSGILDSKALATIVSIYINHLDRKGA